MRRRTLTGEQMKEVQKTKYKLVRHLIRKYGRRSAWKKCVWLDNQADENGTKYFKEIYKELTFQML